METLFENMTKLFVLAETHQLLLSKYESSLQDNQPVAGMRRDLQKIEQEMQAYSGETDVEKVKAMINENMIVPPVYPD